MATYRKHQRLKKELRFWDVYAIATGAVVLSVGLWILNTGA